QKYYTPVRRYVLTLLRAHSYTGNADSWRGAYAKSPLARHSVTHGSGGSADRRLLPGKRELGRERFRRFEPRISPNGFRITNMVDSAAERRAHLPHRGRAFRNHAPAGPWRLARPLPVVVSARLCGARVWTHVLGHRRVSPLFLPPLLQDQP